MSQDFRGQPPVETDSGYFTVSTITFGVIAASFLTACLARHFKRKPSHQPESNLPLERKIQDLRLNTPH